jgi:hypothetical protein
MALPGEHFLDGHRLERFAGAFLSEEFIQRGVPMTIFAFASGLGLFHFSVSLSAW